MTTTRHFSSTDVGAPVLTGQTGATSVINLLSTCLVGTAGVAYGSKAAAGWSAPFTNTSTKAVFRNSVAAGGTGGYCRVLDDGSFAAAAKEAGMFGYATMSDIDTGTDSTPTTATLSTGVIVRKSNTADATARVWELVADELTWYLNIRANTTIGGETSLYGAGDIASEVAGDAYRFFCMGRHSANSTGGACNFVNGPSSFATPSSNGLYVGRGYASTGTSIPLVLALPPGSTPANAIGCITQMADPAPGTTNRYFVPAIIGSEASLRGRLRGVYAPINNLTAQSFGATLASPAGLPVGSSLLVVQANSSGAQTGVFGIEAALAW